MDKNIAPYIRYIAKTTYFINKEVAARDCRMLYILSGSGLFESRGKVYELSENTLLYYPCGTPYRISSNQKILFYTINFDFTQEYSRLSVMTPVKADVFDPNTMIRINHNIVNEMFYDIVYTQDTVDLRTDIENIYYEALHLDSDHIHIQSMYMNIILSKLLRSDSTNANESPLFKKIKEIVVSNPTLSTKEIADILNYHPYYLNAVFSKNTGGTLHKYIIQQRTKTARELILSTEIPIEEIAHKCGFCSQSHLSAAFKSIYNITPGKLRHHM